MLKPTPILKKHVKRVGLLFLTLNTESQTKSLIAHLARRPEKKDVRKRSWPGIYVVTVGSKVKKGEEPLKVLTRELHRKLGAILAYDLMGILLENGHEDQILFQDDRVTIYGLVVEPYVMLAIHPDNHSGHFKKLDILDLAKLIEVKDKWQDQSRNEEHIPVHPETRKAIGEALLKFIENKRRALKSEEQ